MCLRWTRVLWATPRCDGRGPALRNIYELARVLRTRHEARGTEGKLALSQRPGAGAVCSRQSKLGAAQKMGGTSSLTLPLHVARCAPAVGEKPRMCVPRDTCMRKAALSWALGGMQMVSQHRGLVGPSFMAGVPDLCSCCLSLLSQISRGKD